MKEVLPDSKQQEHWTSLGLQVQQLVYCGQVWDQNQTFCSWALIACLVEKGYCREGKPSVGYGAEYGSLMLWDYFVAGSSGAFVRINGLMSSLKYQQVHMSINKFYTPNWTEIFAGAQTWMFAITISGSGSEPYWKPILKQSKGASARRSGPRSYMKSPTLLDMTLRDADVYSRDAFTQY